MNSTRRTFSLGLLLVPLSCHGLRAQTPAVEGQVVKVDEAAGKITLKHGPIRNLDMEGMTMVFRVKDPTMLKGLKAGDAVSFEADRVDGAITVTKITRKP